MITRKELTTPRLFNRYGNLLEAKKDILEERCLNDQSRMFYSRGIPICTRSDSCPYQSRTLFIGLGNTTPIIVPACTYLTKKAQ